LCGTRLIAFNRFKNKNTCNKKRLQKGRFKDEKEFFFKNYGITVGFGNG